MNRQFKLSLAVIPLLLMTTSLVASESEAVEIESAQQLIEIDADLGIQEQEPQENEVSSYQPTEMYEDELTSYPFEEVEIDYTIKDLNTGQQQVLTQWRRSGKDLFARKLGILNIKGTENDLRAMQQLINRKMIKDHETRHWQSLGVLFGDILAKKFSMHWVSYEDRLGVNKVLRWRNTENYIFPITVFSKRVRFGEKIDVFELYAKMEKDIDSFKAYEMRPKLPHLRKPH